MNLLNRRELARLLDVNERTVAAWAAAGLPVRSRSAQRRYDPIAVARWLLTRDLMRADARDGPLFERAAQILRAQP